MSENKKEQITGSDKLAWNDVTSQIVFWVFFSVFLAIDLISKSWVFSVMKVGERITVLEGWLDFHAIYNRGAVFGLGQGRRVIFIVASVLAIIFIIQLFAKTKSNQRFLQILLALVLAGAVGNMYDRIMYHKVRDFIEITFTIGEVPVWPYVFNFADIILVIGVGLLMLGWITGKFEMGCSCSCSGSESASSCSSSSSSRMLSVAKPLVVNEDDTEDVRKE